MSNQHQSSAKHTQQPSGPQDSPRATRSEGAGKQEVACNQPESPKEELKNCKVCGKAFKLLFSHLNRVEACAAQYDMEEEKRKQNDQKRAYDKAYYDKHKEEIKAAKREKQITPERRASMRAYNEKNRDAINESMRQQYKAKVTSSIQPKSPAKRKVPPEVTGARPKSVKEIMQQPSGSNVTRARSNPRDSQAIEPSTPKSPAKREGLCKVCNWTGKCLRSHLAKNKQCSSLYDLDALEDEAKRLHRDQKAARSRERYMDESPRKKTAAKQRYQESPQKKKEAMAAYNEKHREDINFAMRIHSIDSWRKFKCPICEKSFNKKQSRDIHIDHIHSGSHPPSVCQICDKTFEYEQSLERHVREVHEELVYECQKCPAAYVRNSEFQDHIIEDWHYLSYFCNLCMKNNVFKSFGALLQHVIVKQSETAMEFPKGSKLEGQTFTRKKSGILVTCKAHVDSTQEEEGRYLEWCTDDEKKEAYKRRIKRKEEIINEGLKAAWTYEGYEKHMVKVEFVTTHDKKTHNQEEEEKGHCKYCLQKIPFEEDGQFKERHERTLWELHRE